MLTTFKLVKVSNISVAQKQTLSTISAAVQRVHFGRTFNRADILAFFLISRIGGKIAAGHLNQAHADSIIEEEEKPPTHTTS